MIGPVIILILLALFIPKWRIILLSLTICISAVEVLYLIWEKDNEKLKIVENIIAVDEYLTERYPGEDWIISRREGVFLNHGSIEVIFLNELDEGYLYYVEQGRVRQSGGFFRTKDFGESEHYEEEKK